jgi:hypothetical protein
LRLALSALLLSVIAVLLPAHSVAAQDNFARFEIVEPTDTTFSIVLRGARWVKKGMTGYVLDPRERDLMVGRFTVDQVDERTARAKITGMTTGITIFHAAMLPVPRKPWFKQMIFWIGTGLGMTIGYFVGKG